MLFIVNAILLCFMRFSKYKFNYKVCFRVVVFISSVLIFLFLNLNGYILLPDLLANSSLKYLDPIVAITTGSFFKDPYFIAQFIIFAGSLTVTLLFLLDALLIFFFQKAKSTRSLTLGFKWFIISNFSVQLIVVAAAFYAHVNKPDFYKLNVTLPSFVTSSVDKLCPTSGTMVYSVEIPKYLPHKIKTTMSCLELYKGNGYSKGSLTNLTTITKNREYGVSLLEKPTLFIVNKNNQVLYVSKDSYVKGLNYKAVTDFASFIIAENIEPLRIQINNNAIMTSYGLQEDKYKFASDEEQAKKWLTEKV